MDTTEKNTVIITTQQGNITQVITIAYPDLSVKATKMLQDFAEAMLMLGYSTEAVNDALGEVGV